MLSLIDVIDKKESDKKEKNGIHTIAKINYLLLMGNL